ncbi:MAG: hypothetical protein K8H86_04190 [Ignavibacteriaceae bacterium]|nr:hypothetical protein [Ignavibacteriaceae bacterium]
MKILKYFFLFTITALVFYGTAEAQNHYVFGANGSYYIPFGSLADRFKPTAGGSFYFGKETDEIWTWLGRAEYFIFDNENTEKLFLKRKLKVNGVESDYEIPLPDLKLSLEAAGFAAVAEFKILETNFLNVKGTFGFGITRWLYERSAYYDSLYIDTTGAGGMKLAQVLNVPAGSQVDWSGTFDLGVDVNVNVYGPVWINTGVRYKAIIGEIWPALDLDFENISTFQMFDIRAGVRIKL